MDELIKALRKCGKASADRCWSCDYYDREPWCESALANDAADAIEELISELDACKTERDTYREMWRDETEW